MTDWTTLDTDDLLPGEPLTSAKVLALYQNPIAISEGNASAPSPYVGLAARLVAGGIGSFCWARHRDLASVDFGDTVAGSGLITTGGIFRVAMENATGVFNAYLGEADGGLTGTWTCLGTYDNTFRQETQLGGGETSAVQVYGATLWQRTL